MLRYEGAGTGHEEEGNDFLSVLFNQLLVQAAQWKLQAQTLREQATVMQAQVNIQWPTPGANMGRRFLALTPDTTPGTDTKGRHGTSTWAADSWC